MSEENQETEYILFVGQYGNFESRTMLIPAKNFLHVRFEDYQLLKKWAVQKTFTKNNEQITVENFLLDSYVLSDDKNVGSIRTQEIREYTSLCNDLVWYAEGQKNCYARLVDMNWYDVLLCNLTKSFDNLQNLLDLSQLKYFNGKKIKIIESFLFMEARE